MVADVAAAHRPACFGGTAAASVNRPLAGVHVGTPWPPAGPHLREIEMGLFSRKEAAVATLQDPGKPHDYQAPPQPPSSGQVACKVCGKTPNDVIHDVPKEIPDIDLHWS